MPNQRILKVGHKGFTAQPGYSVAGNYVDGGTITITGTGFGSGPNVVLYADWHTGGTLEAEASLTDCVVGQWTGRQGGVGWYPRYRAGRDGGQSLCHTIMVGAEASYGKFYKSGIPQFDEYYISFYWYTGAYLGLPTPNAFGAMNAKTAWVKTLQSETGTGSNSDIYLGVFGDTSPPFYNVDMASNSGLGNASFSKLYTSQWDFSGWNHLESWCKANSASPYSATSTAWMGLHNAVHGRSETLTTAVFGSGKTPYWTAVDVPGFMYNFSDAEANIDFRYDDFYLATGPNSAKRFLITDASTYANSRETYICRTSTWTDTSVGVDIPYMQVGSSLSGKYLHYFDANNSPVVIGAFI